MASGCGLHNWLMIICTHRRCVWDMYYEELEKYEAHLARLAKDADAAIGTGQCTRSGHICVLSGPKLVDVYTCEWSYESLEEEIEGTKHMCESIKQAWMEGTAESELQLVTNWGLISVRHVWNARYEVSVYSNSWFTPKSLEIFELIGSFAPLLSIWHGNIWHALYNILAETSCALSQARTRCHHHQGSRTTQLPHKLYSPLLNAAQRPLNLSLHQMPSCHLMPSLHQKTKL